MSQWRDEIRASVIDIAAGSIGGVGYTLCMHPADTIKVRVQAAKSSRDRPMQVLWNTVRREGAWSLYKGLTSPLAGTIPVTAVTFMAYGQALRAMGVRSEDHISVQQALLAGLWSGLFQSPIICTVDLLKIRMQMQFERDVRQSKHSSPWNAAKSIYRHEGAKGLFRGNFATVLRETSALGMQFASYEACRLWATPPGKKRSELGVGWTLLAGGVSGVCCWTVSYPADVVKTQLQVAAGVTSEGLLVRPYTPFFGDGGFWRCALHLHRTQGSSVFFKGLAPIAAAAFPANAVLFLLYEWTMQTLSFAI